VTLLDSTVVASSRRDDWLMKEEIPTRNGFIHFREFHRQRTRSSSF
jgi:hypothetical protein